MWPHPVHLRSCGGRRIGMMVVLALLTNTVVITKEIQESVCQFDGSSYGEGDRWHPFLPPFGYMTCINCTCTRGGVVLCESEECPRISCDNPVQLEGQCCPICTDPSRWPLEDTSRRQDCRYDGTIYRHNEAFTSTSAAIQPTDNNQCVLCHCLDGEVFCYLKTCPVTECEHPVRPVDDCCPVCPGDDSADILEDLTRYGYKKPQRPLSNQTDCRTDDDLHVNGSQWHPVVTPFGQMPCIICSCLEGSISCRRVVCEDDPSPCRRPQHRPGQCCAVCPNYDREKEEPRRKKKRRCRTSPDDYVVKHAASSSSMATVIIASEAHRRAHVIRWQLNNGIVSNYTSELIRRRRYRELSRSAIYREANTLGTVAKNRINKYKQKIEKYMTRCTRRKRGCPWRKVWRKLQKMKWRKIRAGCEARIRN